MTPTEALRHVGIECATCDGTTMVPVIRNNKIVHRAPMRLAWRDCPACTKELATTASSNTQPTHQTQRGQTCQY